jgi:hypothetical protein
LDAAAAQGAGSASSWAIQRRHSARVRLRAVNERTASMSLDEASRGAGVGAATIAVDATGRAIGCDVLIVGGWWHGARTGKQGLCR